MLLSVALGSTGYPPNDTLPTWCLFQVDVEVKYYDWLYIVILLGYLIVSYICRAIQLFPESTSRIRTSFRTLQGEVCKRWLTSLRNRALKSRSLFWVFMHNLLLSLYCALKATAELYGSMLLEVWVVTLSNAPLNVASPFYRLRG